MKRIVLGGVLAYLLAGLVFAVQAMPEQTWRCPDKRAPHGYVTHSSPVGLSRGDCRATVTATDRLAWFALAVPAWLPLLAAKGYSNGVEQ